MADFPGRDAKLSGATRQPLKTGSKMKDTSRFRTLTSDRTSETRAPVPSSAEVSGALGPVELTEEQALASKHEEADSIFEDSQDSDSDCGADKVDIPAHRRSFNEDDCDAAPRIIKLDHVSILQELLAEGGSEINLLDDTGDDEAYDESLVQWADWACPEEPPAHMVVRVHPALQAGEQYQEVPLEEWQESGGDSETQEGPVAEEEPSRWWSPPQLSRIHSCGGGGAGEQRASLLAGSPAMALRRWRDVAPQDSPQDFAAESPPGVGDP